MQAASQSRRVVRWNRPCGRGKTVESLLARVGLLVGIGAVLMVLASYVPDPFGAIMFILGAIAVGLGIILLIAHLVRGP